MKKQSRILPGSTLTEDYKDVASRFKPGCICKGIRLGKILDAIKGGAKNFKEVSKKTGIGGGSCGAVRCGNTVKELLDETAGEEKREAKGEEKHTGR